MIPTTKVLNGRDTIYSYSYTALCSDTDDKVFLLSYQETSDELCFGNDSERKRSLTDFDLANRIINYSGYAQWWLRSPRASYADENSNSNVNITSEDGVKEANGYPYETVTSSNIGVVPAICIDPQ